MTQSPLAVTLVSNRAGHLCPHSPKPTLLCKLETQILYSRVDKAEKSFQWHFLQVSFSQTSTATGSRVRRADLGAALPAPPGKPGVPALSSHPTPSGWRHEGAGPARWTPARVSPGTQTGPLPRPRRPSASAAGSSHFTAGPRVAWAAVSFLLTSSVASRGRSRHYLHKGRAGRVRRTPSAGPQQPSPASAPPPAALRPRGVGAFMGRGPRSGQSAAPSSSEVGPRPVRIYTRCCRPAPALTCAHLASEPLAAPSVPPPPGGRNSSRDARRPRATSQVRQQKGAVPPTIRPGAV